MQGGKHERAASRQRQAGVVTAVLAAYVAGCSGGASASSAFDFTAPVRGREGASSGALSEISASSVAPSVTPGSSEGSGGSGAGTVQGGGGSLPIAVGQTVRGRLQRGDAQLEQGALVDEYMFLGSAGDQVTILLRGGTQVGTGSHLDVYLYLVYNGREITRDDDSAGNLDSRIVARLPQTGAYTIRVSTFGGNVREGEYTLSLRSGEHID